jgi:hypothetical protein
MLVAHRINTLEQLEELSETMPIEFDVRDSNGHCIVEHDPFKVGVPLDIFLDKCKKRFLIINIKSEGIEKAIFDMLRIRKIDSFFMLDCTIPVIYKFTLQGERRFAVRLSEVEPLEFALQWKGKVDWVWVDCFSRNILTKDIEIILHANGFKLCIVSPELQGRPQDISHYSQEFHDSSIHIDAICTKSYNMDIWKRLYHI